MGSNITPNYTDYKDLKPFKFWCQKVLPAIYDDSLSYYELLCKVVNYLNDVIENMEGVEENTDALLEAFGLLQDYVNNYFDSLDVREAIDAELDFMVQTGAFDEAIGRAVADNISSAVADQLGDVVESQIQGVVADQIDGAVEEQIGADAAAAAAQAAAAWLDDNLSPTGTTVAIDTSLTVSGSAADARAAGIRLAQLDSEMKGNRYDVLAKSASYSDYSVSGISFTYDLIARTVTINGTATGNGWANIYSDTNSFPDGMVRGGHYIVDFDTPDITKLTLQSYINIGGNLSFLSAGGKYTPLAIPDNAIGILFRMYFVTGFTADNLTIPLPKVWTEEPLKQFVKSKTSYLPSMNLNDFIGNQNGLLVDSESYINAPSGVTVGFIECIQTGNWSLQMLYSFTGGSIWKRRGNSDGSTWESWIKLMGATNEYVTNYYSNTYNVEATPSISTGNNYFLASTGDTTDRTSDIISLLESQGICRLGSGVFYVKNLVMPVGSRITGQGKITKIVLDSTGEFALQMDSFCKIDNVYITGALNEITPLEQIGSRNGIVWAGTYSINQEAPYMALISDIWIDRFTGSGIKLIDTGYSSLTNIMCSNVYIRNCSAGVNISYWSEFNKFVNVKCHSCWYGCINNGGNNMFANCDFSSNILGFLIDNSENQSPNNSHGSCVGCVFNHSDSNTGIGIKLLKADSGFMFSGCQFFYSKIHSYDSYGIVFNACDFGYNNCNIIIENGGAHLFANNIFQNKPPITVTGNNKTHFVNNYNKTSGALIEP